MYSMTCSRFDALTENAAVRRKADYLREHHPDLYERLNRAQSAAFQRTHQPEEQEAD